VKRIGLRSVDFRQIERLQRGTRPRASSPATRRIWPRQGCELIGLEFRRIMAALAHRGAHAILFGCTELDLLVGAEDSPVPVLGATRVHAERLVDLALAT
jgi:hypothetical protein